MITKLLEQMPTGLKVAKIIDYHTFKTILKHKGYNPKEIIKSLYKEGHLKVRKSVNTLTISKIGLAQYFVDLSPFKSYISKKRKKFNGKNSTYITIKFNSVEELELSINS